MLFQLLETAAEDAAGTKNNGYPQWVSYVLIGVLVVVLVVSMILMNRRSKKRNEEDRQKRAMVRPGHKVTTVGGICGIVVEVDDEEETFVLETGTEASGKSYMKFVRQAILESDAFDEKKEDDKKGDKVVEETEEAPAEVAPSEEEAAEAKTEEKPADKE